MLMGWRKFLLVVAVLFPVQKTISGLPDCQCLLGAVKCGDDTVAKDALAYLQDNCHGECKFNAECQVRFFRLEQIAYGCPPEFLPLNILTAMHSFDTKCNHCREYRPSVSMLDNCPEEQCLEDKIKSTWSNFVSKGCKENCTTEDCRMEFQRLYATMYGCNPSSIPSIPKIGFYSVNAGSCIQKQCNMERTVDCENPTNIEFSNMYASDGGSSLSGGAVAGIAISAVVAAAIVLSGTYIALRKRSSKDSSFLHMAERYQT